MKKNIQQLLIKIIWPKYIKEGGVNQGFLLMCNSWFIQKILRINAHVPWPVHFTSKVISPSKITFGSRTPGLSNGCHIDGRNGIAFGENVWVGPKVSIISMNHDVNNYYKYSQCEPISIGKNSWLGANSIILPGVKLGDHTIVAAGAIVTKSFPEGNQVLAGIPAKVIKKLEDYV